MKWMIALLLSLSKTFCFEIEKNSDSNLEICSEITKLQEKQLHVLTSLEYRE